MRINQNIAAMNAYRNLSATSSQQSKSLERLSSGFRINRAADDAAGLAISEKLRGQVKGLNQAVSNAQNGISLIQTAEGALNESHSIVQRMRELAVQSANDTNTDADRTQIQKEVNQLTEELTRITDTTEFNTKKLLDGSFKSASFQIGANEGQSLEVSIGEMSASALGVAGAAKFSTTATLGTAGDLANGSYTVKSNGGANDFALVDSSGNTVATSSDGGNEYVLASDPTKSVDFGGTTESHQVRSGTVKVDGTAVTATGTAQRGGTGTARLDVGQYELRGTAGAEQLFNVKTNEQVGTYASATGVLTLTDADGGTSTYTMDPDAAAGSKVTVEGADVSSQASASATISVLDKALAAISDQRSTLGAVQNRLDHTINNLSVASENLAASESRIRDTDMASEMMSFTRAQILSQAGTAMLAQANQIPQGVLSLLR